MRFAGDDPYGIREANKKKLHKFAKKPSWQKGMRPTTSKPNKSNPTLTTTPSRVAIERVIDVREAAVQILGKGMVSTDAKAIVAAAPSTGSGWLDSWRYIAFVMLKRILAENEARGTGDKGTTRKAAKL